MSVDVIIEFMITREASPSILAALRNEKIDVETVLQVDDQSLSQFIPKLGDRVALRTYCTKTVQKSKKKNSKRSELFDVLKMKLPRESHKKSPEKDSKTRKTDWRLRSRKETRKIEFGWMHNDHQVRKRFGGGVRKVDVKRSLCKPELLEIAKGLFFPNGESIKGSLDDFTCELLDFKQNPFPNGMSVTDCYDLFKIGIVTFYLHTKSDEETKTTSAQADDDELSSDQIGLGEASGQATSSDDTSGQDTKIQDDFSSNGIQDENAEAVVPIGFLQERWIQTQSTETRNDILQDAVDAIGSFDDDLPDVDVGNLPVIDFGQTNQDDTSRILPERDTALLSVQMTIHRGSLAFAEILGYFKDADILNKIVNVVRILPNGKEEMAEDTGGVLRDTITEFGEHFYSQFTIGRNVKDLFGMTSDWKNGKLLVVYWCSDGRDLTTGHSSCPKFSSYSAFRLAAILIHQS